MKIPSMCAPEQERGTFNFGNFLAVVHIKRVDNVHNSTLAYFPKLIKCHMMFPQQYGCQQLPHSGNVFSMVQPCFLKSSAQMPCESGVHMKVYYEGSQEAKLRKEDTDKRTQTEALEGSNSLIDKNADKKKHTMQVNA